MLLNRHSGLAARTLGGSAVARTEGREWARPAQGSGPRHLEYLISSLRF